MLELKIVKDKKAEVERGRNQLNSNYRHDLFSDKKKKIKSRNQVFFEAKNQLSRKDIRGRKNNRFSNLIRQCSIKVSKSAKLKSIFKFKIL